MEMTPLQILRRRLWLYEEEIQLIFCHPEFFENTDPEEVRAEIEANTERCVREYFEATVKANWKEALDDS